MLKKLTVAAKWAGAIILIVGAIAAMTYEEHRATEKYKAECQSEVAAVASSGSGHAPHGADECKDPKEYMPWWYVLAAWPDGITTWALLATLGAIVWQAIETRRAADAVRVQVRQVVSRERAWLVVEPGPIDFDDPPASKYYIRTNLRIENSGGGRALIIQSGWRFLTGVPHQKVPKATVPFDIPRGRIDGNQEAKLTLWLDGGGDDLRTISAQIGGGERALHLYGFIEYETAGTFWRKDFGYSWVPITGGLAVYSIDRGLWTRDLRRDKPEREIKRPN